MQCQIYPIGKRRTTIGGGSWDSNRYVSDKKLRVDSGVADFAYTTSAHKVHDNLDPKRIIKKPFEKLESRDSAEHPESNAVFVSFDVTGSNFTRAVDAQKKLPNLMELLRKYLPDPQVAVAANDDFNFKGHNSIQISDFESDNRVDEHIRNIWLTRDGGGNDGESYDLIMYGAANLVVMDCLEKRGRKGYFFMYADEPIFTAVDPHQVENIFGITLQQAVPIEEVIEDLKAKYHVFVVWPEGGYVHARKQYVDLFGEECVLTLQHPNLICELIASAVGLNEEKVSPTDLVEDLVSVGTDSADAQNVSTSLAQYVKQRGDIAKTNLPRSSAAGASRL